MLNKDIETRDMLIFGSYEQEKYTGGIRRFEGLSAQTLGLLLKLGFTDPGDSQNGAPAASEMHAFLCKYPDYTAHGYAVGIDRSDYRVSIEGVVKDHGYDSDRERMDFVRRFRDADELEAGRTRMFCWYD